MLAARARYSSLYQIFQVVPIDSVAMILFQHSSRSIFDWPLDQTQLLFQTIDQISDWLHLSVAPIIEVEALRHLPPGTLGRAVADFLDQHHLHTMDSGPRRKQLHDTIHVLTGYGTDLVGEAEVQAFLLGTKVRLAHLILIAAIMHRYACQSSESVQLCWDRVWQAYQRGWHSSFDLDRWAPETLWHLPLAQVCDQMGI